MKLKEKQMINETQVLETIIGDIEQSKESNIVIVAGHFPIIVNETRDGLIEDFDAWGIFSRYTLELGTTIGEYARNKGKNVKFAIVCDDAIYRDAQKNLLTTNFHERSQDRIWSKKRGEFYKKKSGVSAAIPKEYEKIMQNKDFDISSVLKHDHGKKFREDCIYFSEAVLGNKKKTSESVGSGSHECMKKYVALINDTALRNLGGYYLVGFIPQRCSHFVCDAVSFIANENSSHVFFSTKPPAKNPLELYSLGAMYFRTQKE